jgi:hypothetical protein
MSDEKNKIVVKKLKCGGYGIYSTDAKTKSVIQTGYIGESLNVEAWIPAGAVIEKN